MTYEEFDKRCDELENAPLPERKTFFADVLAGETEKTDVRMMAYFRYALLLYREGDFRTAREILEPFIIDYKSYRYRPEIIACFNLVGLVATMCGSTHCPASTFMRALKLRGNTARSAVTPMSTTTLP